MISAKLGGFRPEPEELQARHWTFSSVRAGVLAEASIAAGVARGSIDGMASDLRPYSSPRHDQRRTNSCVPQSIVKALEIKRIQKYGHGAHVDLSVGALYYLARELMLPPETDQDEGTYLSVAADCLRRYGICPEADWPFVDGALFTAPSWRAMRRAYVHKISAWYRLDSSGIDRVQDVIANLAVGNPVPYGTTIGDNWLDYQAGQVLRKVDGMVRGRHATTIVGWNPNLHGGVFIGENSWGGGLDGWGDDGFYLIGPEVIAAVESSDFLAMAGGWETWGNSP